MKTKEGKLKKSLKAAEIERTIRNPSKLDHLKMSLLQIKIGSLNRILNSRRDSWDASPGATLTKPEQLVHISLRPDF
jgi:hypothetical protein